MLAAPADDMVKRCKMMQREDRTVMTIPEKRTAWPTMSAVLPSQSQTQGEWSRHRIAAGKLESRTLEEEGMMAQELMTTLNPPNVFENVLASISDFNANPLPPVPWKVWIRKNQSKKKHHQVQQRVQFFA